MGGVLCQEAQQGLGLRLAALIARMKERKNEREREREMYVHRAYMYLSMYACVGTYGYVGIQGDEEGLAFPYTWGRKIDSSRLCNASHGASQKATLILEALRSRSGHQRIPVQRIGFRVEGQENQLAPVRRTGSHAEGWGMKDQRLSFILAGSSPECGPYGIYIHIYP